MYKMNIFLTSVWNMYAHSDAKAKKSKKEKWISSLAEQQCHPNKSKNYTRDCFLQKPFKKPFPTMLLFTFSTKVPR